MKTEDASLLGGVCIDGVIVLTVDAIVIGFESASSVLRYVLRRFQLVDSSRS